ncbi:iron chelate uptake ABC transporter family permease subunit [Corynebacterium suedekumii]|nr:iron chelate uptake ABC transporter family permease subunit [Corynebacterium suedekumii]
MPAGGGHRPPLAHPPPPQSPGRCCVVGADTLGRVIARPSEIAVAVLTPVLGAPLFIWIVRRQKRS